ncbi:hypothetical protein DRP04_14975 [Archaeoglobales archaeon]|nr:MAG: hypothetical protein DRP04_14975 [Archaeoglobales archaeon]
MKDLLASDRKKIDILKTLSDGRVYTYYHLSRILRTNYETVKKNCRFLELLDLVEVIKVDKEESASGVASYRVRITEQGLKAFEKIKALI